MRSIALTIVLTMISTAAAAECSCPGAAASTYRGGDANPLSWSFQASLSQPGGSREPVYCYHRSVKNALEAPVYSVRWEIASFYRQLVRGGDDASSCPVYLGDISPRPINGPLNFNVASRYDTTVQPPEHGWGTPTGGLASDGSMADLIAPKLESRIDFDVEDSEGKAKSVSLDFVSEAYVKNRQLGLYYFIRNVSEQPVYVLLNLSIDKSMIDRLPIVAKPIKIGPKDVAKFFIENLEFSYVRNLPPSSFATTKARSPPSIG